MPIFGALKRPRNCSKIQPLYSKDIQNNLLHKNSVQPLNIWIYPHTIPGTLEQENRIF